ncbi:MAG TPA: hypothetical protein VF547_10730 [Allosphingosinicella sp.]|jgi:hypothetical protein
MKKILFALAATTALAAAAPAAAQYGMAGHGQIRSDQLQLQLQAGVRSGAISRAEAMPLREQLRQLTRLETLYARDGISGRERADLQHRINSLRQGIRMAARNGDGRFDRDDDRYDHDGRYSRADERYDRDNDGWDDRDGNRDGRWDVDARNDSNRDGWDDRDFDRDGRWDNDEGYARDRVDDRGVVGQIIDRVTGTGGLRVGQRASADLGALPYAYRSRYHDNDSAYYRSDGRQIYEIDARTQTVVRVYAMNR